METRAVPTHHQDRAGAGCPPRSRLGVPGGGCRPLARQCNTPVSHPNRRQGKGCVSPGQLFQQEEQLRASKPNLIFTKLLLLTAVGRKEFSQLDGGPWVHSHRPPPFPLNTRVAALSSSSTTKMRFMGILLQCYKLVCPQQAHARSFEQCCRGSCSPHAPAGAERGDAASPELSQRRARPRCSLLATSEPPARAKNQHIANESSEPSPSAAQ